MGGTKKPAIRCGHGSPGKGKFFLGGGDISMPTASIEDIRRAVDISTSYVIWQG